MLFFGYTVLELHEFCYITPGFESFQITDKLFYMLYVCIVVCANLPFAMNQYYALRYVSSVT